MEVLVAALLHDVDDHKYFPNQSNSYENAKSILNAAQVPLCSWERILFMIDAVSCSKNGNIVPARVAESGAYQMLIPRYADRIEAVGAKGVVRSYRYNLEVGNPLCSEYSPRPQSEDEVWQRATPQRFAEY